MSKISNLTLAGGILLGTAACDYSPEESAPVECLEVVEDPIRNNTGKFEVDHPCRWNKEYQNEFPFETNARIALAITMVIHPDISAEEVKEGVRIDIAKLQKTFEPLGVEFFITEVREIPFNPPYPNLSQTDLIGYYTRIWSSDYVDVMYLPHEGGHIAGKAANNNSNHFINGHVAMFYDHNRDNSRTDGRVINPIALPHEIGHRFGLYHPFTKVGDNIKDTINYQMACGEYKIKTFEDEDTGQCMTACNDGCHPQPANIMDYTNAHNCENSLPGFTQDQLSTMNCFLHQPEGWFEVPGLGHFTPGPNLNPELPEVKL